MSETIDFSPVRFVLAPEPQPSDARTLEIDAQNSQAVLSKSQVQALYAWLAANVALFT